MAKYNSKICYQVLILPTINYYNQVHYLVSVYLLKLLLYFDNIEQQFIQLADGKFHVNNYINQSSTPRAVPITKNELLTNTNNFTKTGTQVRSEILLIHFIHVIHSLT